MWKHKESRHKRGYGTQWEKTRVHVLSRDMYQCQVCLKANRLTPATQVDHIIPKSKDGTDDHTNLQSICDDCHKAKTLEEQGKTLRPSIDIDGYPIER